MNEENLDQSYWNERYAHSDTPWDIGYASPPLTAYLKKKLFPGIRILIPGAGNAHEAQWLLENGSNFSLTIVDISQDVTEKLKKALSNHTNVEVFCEDFFIHEGKYDLIIEQTFFCALEPSLRNKYMEKMHDLLAENGRLAGLLFNIEFDKSGPPFGGDIKHYINLFNVYFTEYNVDMHPTSVPKRKGNEIFFEVTKRKKNE